MTTPQSLNHLVQLKCGGVSLILIKHIVFVCLFVCLMIITGNDEGHLQQGKEEKFGLFSYFPIFILYSLPHWGQC